MRILVISDLPPYVTGGAEAQAARLVTRWAADGHHVEVIGRRLEPGRMVLGGHAVRLHRIRHVRHAGRALRGLTYAASLAWLLLGRARACDMIYTRFLGEGAATAAALKAAGLVRAPLVSTPANTGGQGDITFLRSVPFARLLIRLLDRQCDAINLIAPAMEAEIRSAGFSTVRSSHIPNGVPVHPLPPRDVAGPLRLVSVGRLAHQKGYDILLQALAQVGTTTPFRVSIAGDGPERPALEAMTRSLGLADRVTWLGECGPEAVRDLLDHASAFILPSRYEGMSNAALEAMERALPVVLTACGGIDRHIGPDCGWVVPCGDPDALSVALEALLTLDPEARRAMGAAARARIESHFDITVVARRYLDLFEELRGHRDGTG